MKRVFLLMPVLVAVLVVAACAGPPGPGVEPMTRTFDISIGHQDSYARPALVDIGVPGDVRVATFYRWQPPVLVVFEGDSVVLNVTNESESRVHSFVLPAFDLNTGEIPNTPAGTTPTIMTVEFVADTPGVYMFQCGTPFDPEQTPTRCSPEHKYQTGWIIVLDR